MYPYRGIHPTLATIYFQYKNHNSSGEC